MSNSHDCPTEQSLIEYCDGRLEASRVDEIRLHLEQCEPCSEAEQWIHAHLLRPISDDDEEEAVEPSLPMDATRSLDTREKEIILDESNIDHSLFSDPRDERAMGRLGKYDVFKMLGQGGMGVVLQAHNEQLRRDVAIKMLNRSLSASTVARRRFIREARAAAAINHPNVVIIHDVDECHNVPFIVMELVAGRTLRDEIRRTGSLDSIRVTRLSTQIAQGLASAHSQGVIHRDIKPGNIMLEADVDRVKITDFGLARAAIDNIELTSRELAVGTPAYMSPEQVAGETVDARSDLFALGCVMYAMLTGHSPFHGRNALEIARKVEVYEPRNLHDLDPNIPSFLADLVAKLLAKEPEDRYQSAAEVADVLNRHLAILNQAPSDQLGRLLREDPEPEDTPPKSASRRVLAGISIGLLAIVVITVAIFANPERQPLKQTGGVEGENKQSLFSVPSEDVAPAPAELMVSATDSADFRTLSEALAAAGAGTIIRVLDDAVYEEAIEIGGLKHERLQLISERRARIAPNAVVDSERHSLVLRDTHDVTIKGFAIDSAANGHAVYIEGSAAGLTLEDLQCENKSTDGPYATVQIVISTETPDAPAPFQMKQCRVINQSDSPCVWVHRPYHDVVIERCLFSAVGTGVALWDTCESLRINHNVFLTGRDGVGLATKSWPEGCDIQIYNNTFLNSMTWIGFADDCVAGGQVAVANNLVLGSAAIGMSAEQRAYVVGEWRFCSNHWERSAQTAEDAGWGGNAAILHEPGTLAVPRDQNSPDFLVPPPGSILLSSECGDPFPAFVGAKDRPNRQADNR